MVAGKMSGTVGCWSGIFGGKGYSNLGDRLNGVPRIDEGEWKVKFAISV